MTAFDSKGCFRSFYRHRCAWCEEDMPRNAENQRVCYRAKCKKAWRDGVIISRFLGIGSGSDRHPLRKSIKSGLREADKVGRGWRTIAGPALSPRSLAAATITDGPGLMWKGGAFEASEARNRKALEDHFAKRAPDRIDDRCAVCGRTDDLKDVQVNGAWTIVCYGCSGRFISVARQASPGLL